MLFATINPWTNCNPIRCLLEASAGASASSTEIFHDNADFHTTSDHDAISLFSFRHLIIYGILKRIIRRVHEYPIIILSNDYDTTSRKELFFVRDTAIDKANGTCRSDWMKKLPPKFETISEKEFSEFIRGCNGKRNMDELSHILKRSYSELKYVLEHVLPKDARIAKILFMRR